MITWLQLSDLHIQSGDEYDNNIVLQALLKDIAGQIRTEGLQPDFIFITGDLAFASHSDEYAMAQRFLDELIQTTGIDGKDRIFIIPGNHDVDRSVITPLAANAVNVLNNRDAVNQFLASEEDRKLVFRKFSNYADFVNDYFGEHLSFTDEQYFYARTLEIQSQNIALLGLNSAWMSGAHKDEEGKVDDENHLLVGERQVRDALEAAQDASLRIAAIHHPFGWLSEFDKADVQALLTQECDFILHGHLHQTEQLQEKAPDSRAMTIAAGACYETRAYPTSYNFVRLDFGKRTGTIYLRRYDDESRTWNKDNLTYQNVDGEWSWDIGYLSAQPSEKGRKAILIIFCHADDMELGCVGTLKRFKDEEGFKIYGLMLTDNSGTAKDNDKETEEEIIRQRKEEAQKSWKLLGFGCERLFFGEFKDGYFYNDRDSVSKIREVVREIRPSIVFTHSEHDKHSDHLHAAQATIAAIRDIPIVKYEILYSVKKEEFDSTPDNRKPYVDITETLKTKLSALRCYESEIRRGRVDIEEVKKYIEDRGSEAGFQYAECFQTEDEEVIKKYPKIFVVPWVNVEKAVCEQEHEQGECLSRGCCEIIHRIPQRVCVSWEKLKPEYDLSQFPEYLRDEKGKINVVVILGDRRVPEILERRCAPRAASSSDAVEFINQVAAMETSIINASTDEWVGVENLVANNNLIVVGGCDVNVHAQVPNNILKQQKLMWFSDFSEVIRAGQKGLVFKRFGHLNDFAIVFLLKNPYNPKYYVLWLAGVSGKGTAAAIRFALRDASNYNFNSSGIAVERPIGCIVRAYPDGVRREIRGYELWYAVDVQGKSWRRTNGV